MPATVQKNSLEGETPPDVPRKEDGTFYEHIMYFDGGRRIGYSDDLADLTALLVASPPESYLESDPEARAEMRLGFAGLIQREVMRQVTAEMTSEEFASLAEWERKVLEGEVEDAGTVEYAPHGWWREMLREGDDDWEENDKDAEEAIDIWTSPTPLVLMRISYAPYTDIQPPLSNPEGTNIVWISTRTEEEFLDSMHNAGLITLGQNRDTLPDD